MTEQFGSVKEKKKDTGLSEKFRVRSLFSAEIFVKSRSISTRVQGV